MDGACSGAASPRAGHDVGSILNRFCAVPIHVQLNGDEFPNLATYQGGGYRLIVLLGTCSAGRWWMVGRGGRITLFQPRSQHRLVVPDSPSWKRTVCGMVNVITRDVTSEVSSSKVVRKNESTRWTCLYSRLEYTYGLTTLKQNSAIKQYLKEYMTEFRWSY